MDAATLVSLLDQAVPGFRSHSECADNLFSRETLHGVFAACCNYVREQPPGPDRWRNLAEVVNQAANGVDEVLRNAACTCFLENLATVGHPLEQHLRDDALAYWRRWCDQG